MFRGSCSLGDGAIGHTHLTITAFAAEQTNGPQPITESVSQVTSCIPCAASIPWEENEQRECRI